MSAQPKLSMSESKNPFAPPHTAARRRFIPIKTVRAARPLLLLLIILPAVVQAQFTFATNNGAITITGYTGSNGMVTIPDTIERLPVTSIGDWAFYGTSVTNVLIPDSVTNIGDGVFFDCESLTNIVIGSSVTSIGDWTFGFCPNLMSICCRGNEPGLGGGNVFYGNLATIYYLSVATGWGPMFDGHPAVLWNPPVPFTYTTNSDGITLSITGYTGSDSAVTIPDRINFLPVTCIVSCQFGYRSGVTSVTVPDSVTNIGFGAFEPFYYTTGPPPDFSLGAITVNTNNPAYSSVDGVLFDKIQGTLIQYPCGKAGSDYTIPDSVINIADDAFYCCTNLFSVTIPDSVTSVGYAAFEWCFNLTNAIIGNSVASIGDSAFSRTSLSSVTIGTNVTSIGDSAFSRTKLTNLTIGDSVTNIGDGAFAGCHSLTGVYFSGNAPSVGSDIFGGDNNATLYYLPGTTGWDDFSISTGLTPVLWNPQAQTGDGSFGVQSNRFGFNIVGTTNIPIVLEACTNLTGSVWETLQNCTLTNGSIYFGDSDWTNYPCRYYRIRSP